MVKRSHGLGNPRIIFLIFSHDIGSMRLRYKTGQIGLWDADGSLSVEVVIA